MSRIIRTVRLCGSTCVELDAQIDSGADKTLVPESVAKKVGLIDKDCESVLYQYDGTPVNGRIMEGKLEVKGTCCKVKQEFIVVPDDHLNNSILIGNDIMDRTGMTIDMDRKRETVKCDCGSRVENIERELEKIKGNNG